MTTVPAGGERRQMPKIMVIEDNPLAGVLLHNFLEDQGFDVISVKNGPVDLRIVKEQVPSLIVCDINMPELGGGEVMKLVRQDPTTATIPFIFLTGEVGDIYRCQEMGLDADDDPNQPTVVAKFLMAIAAQLGLSNAPAR